MSKKIRVLLVVPRMNIGGAESHVDQVARGLQKMGCEVEIASGGGVLAQGLVESGFTHHLVPVRINFHWAVYRLNKIVKEGNFDLIHAHSNAAGPIVAAVAKKHRLPWIYTAHTGIRPPRMEAFGEATQILAVSDFVKEIVLRKGQDFIDPRKVRTFYNAIDCTYFQERGLRDQVRKEWGVEDDTYVVGIVARLLKPERKGHYDLLEVLTHPEAQKWKLAIIGKAHWWYGKTRKVQKRAKELGVEDRVIWVGHQIDVRPSLEGSDVIALPSVSEGCPLALQEAMAMNRPVVAYDGSGTVEVIGDNEGGILVPLGNKEMLFKALAKLMDPEIRSQTGREGRERIERLYDLPQYIEQLITVYKEALQDKG